MNIGQWVTHYNRKWGFNCLKIVTSVMSMKKSKNAFERIASRRHAVRVPVVHDKKLIRVAATMGVGVASVINQAIAEYVAKFNEGNNTK
jgi:hypothetical protein